MKENGSSLETDEGKARKKGQSSPSTTERDFGEPTRSAGEQSGQVIEGTGDMRQRFETTQRDLRTEMDAMSQTVRQATQEVGSYLREQLQERPYATLGAAAGLGFVLGGGFSWRVGSLLFGTGGRVLASMVLREVLRPAGNGLE